MSQSTLASSSQASSLGSKKELGSTASVLQDSPTVPRTLSVPYHVELRRRQEREKEPVFIIRWIVDKPKTWFCK